VGPVRTLVGMANDRVSCRTLRSPAGIASEGPFTVQPLPILVAPGTRIGKYALTSGSDRGSRAARCSSLLFALVTGLPMHHRSPGYRRGEPPGLPAPGGIHQPPPRSWAFIHSTKPERL
jgi:hypothetical protein